MRITLKKKSGRTNFNGILLYKRVPPKFKKSFNVNSSLYLSTSLCVFMCYVFGKKTQPTKGVIKYANGGFSCINVPLGVKPGDFIKTIIALDYRLGKIGKLGLGDTLFLYFLPDRSVFFNISSHEQRTNVIAKSSGTYCFVVAFEKSKGYTKIQMPSGNHKYVYNFVFVTLGRNSNPHRNSVVVGKAGDNVNSGYKSSVRGVAMNPVDHPHGGRTKTNSPEKTPWGRVAKHSK